MREAIQKDFGGLERVRKQFNHAVRSRETSPQVCLSLDNTARLCVEAFPDTVCPGAEGLPPILGIAVSEHAYSLGYPADRAKYAEAFWHLVN